VSGWLAVVGVFVLGVGGLFMGETDRIDADPEVRAMREAEKRERERQEAWRRKRDEP
jgi:hypothetical protein